MLPCREIAESNKRIQAAGWRPRIQERCFACKSHLLLDRHISSTTLCVVSPHSYTIAPASLCFPRTLPRGIDFAVKPTSARCQASRPFGTCPPRNVPSAVKPVRTQHGWLQCRGTRRASNQARRKESHASRPRKRLLQRCCGAKAAAEHEHQDLGVVAAFRKHWKAALWSIGLSTALVMEGYDVVVINSFYGSNAFIDRFGTVLGNGEKVITAPWQTGLSNSALVGEVAGLMIQVGLRTAGATDPSTWPRWPS